MPYRMSPARPLWLVFSYFLPKSSTSLNFVTYHLACQSQRTQVCYRITKASRLRRISILMAGAVFLALCGVILLSISNGSWAKLRDCYDLFNDKDVLCLLLGVTTLPIRVFVALSTVGRMPTTAAFSMQGAAFFGRDYALLIIVSGLCILFATVAYMARGPLCRWMDGQHKKNTG